MKGKKFGIILCSIIFAFMGIVMYSTQVKADTSTAGDTYVIIDGTYYYAYGNAGEMIDVTTSSSSITYSGDYINIIYITGGGTSDSFSNDENAYMVYAGSYEIYVEDFYGSGGDDILCINLTVTSSSSSSGSGSGSSSSSDTTAPEWWTSNTTSIKSGSSVYVELTDETKLWGYSSASTYYKYGWSTSNSTFNGTYLTSFNTTSSTEVSFYATAPTVTSSTTYYLWIYYQGKDDADNVATYSGKTPYYIGTSYSDYVKYQYTVTAASTDTTAPVWYTANTSSITSGSSVSVQLTDNVSIYSYSSSTYYKYGWSTSSSSSPSSWFTTFSSQTSTKVAFSITVPTVTSSTIYYLWIYNQGKDSSDNVSTFSGKTPYYKGTTAGSYVKYQYTVTPAATDTTAPVMRINSTSGTPLSTSSTNYYNVSSKTFYFSDADSGFKKATHDYAGAPQEGVYDVTTTSITLYEGYEYTITVYDNAGNTAKYKIVLDTTKPTITCGGTTLSTSYTYKTSSCTLSFSDTYYDQYKVYKDGSSTASSSGTSTSYSLSSDGSYIITAWDKANNSSTVYLIIDSVKPVWYTSNVSSISAGSTVTFELTDSGSGVYNYSSAASYYKYGWSTSSSSGPTYSTTFTSATSSKVAFSTTAPSPTSDTTYYLWIYDLGQDVAGNVATYSGKTPYFYGNGTSATNYLKYSYTIIANDTTAPTITCGTSLSTTRTYKNSSCSLVFSDNKNLASYTISGAKSASGTISGTSYTYGTLSTAGAYTIVVKDAAGNSTTGYLTLDFIAPVMRINSTSGTALSTSSTNYYSASSKVFYFSDASSGFSKATHDYAGAPQAGVYDVTSTSITLYEGYEYTITVYDKAGNTAKYKIILDATAPTITCGGTTLSTTRVYKNAACTLTFSDNYFSYYYVYNETDENVEDPKGTSTSYALTSSYESAYTIKAYDYAGNVTIGYITIDLTAPVMRVGSTSGTALTAGSTYYYSSSKTFYFSDALSGYYRAHHDYTTAPQDGVFYITASSYTLSITGVTYTITVYDNAGNNAKFYIVIDTTAPTIKCGTTTLSSSRVYTNASCTLSFSDDNFKSYSISGAVSTSGTSTSYTISSEGNYTVIAYDKAGNSKTGYITIDKTAPVMRANSTSGTALTAGGTINYFAASSMEFYFSDALSGYYKATYDFATAPSDAIYDTTNSSMVLGTGLEYRIKVYDIAGNSATFYIILDNTAPTIKCGDTALSSSSSSPTYKTSSCSLIFNDNISLYGNYYSIYKDGTRIDKDDMTGTTSYTYGTLSTEGVYEITIEDTASNSTTGYITIDKTSPIMRADSTSGTALNVTNSSETIINYFTGESKTFYFSDALSGYYRTHHDYVTAPSSALYYTTNSSITLYKGYTYRITVYDYAGNSAKYMIKLSGSTDNISTDAILASATLSNGKITFNKASSNNIQEIYKNGTVRYFVGKPDVYDDNLSDAFDKYGVTVSASTFFASAWTTPQGLVGQFKLYVELSGTNLSTIFAKSSAINITNTGTSTTSFTLELENPLEELSSSQIVALTSSNIVVKENTIKGNYLLFVSMIVISSLLAIEVIIIRNSKKKKAHN